MANINLMRVDFRLIHGQVVTKWCNQVNANRIVIINDALYNDSFMRSIYEMAAPPGIAVEVYTVEKAAQLWKENEMGTGNILVLFKDVNTPLRAFKQGFPIKELQLGGLGGGPGKINVFSAISLSAQEVEDLKQMAKMGVKIVIHVVPEGKKADFENVIQKSKFKTKL
jgi:D-glucosaminate-specific PTS system IIB component